MAVLSSRGSRIVLSFVLSAIISGTAQGQRVTDQDVKAVFLYKFTNFIEWPPPAAQDSEPFRVCVVADKSMTAIIARTIKGESLNGRAMQTVTPDSPEEARRCQMLFIGRTETARAPLLAAVRDLPVLTVGDAEEFLAEGGIIGFVLEEKRVRFEISVDNARRAGLRISARLLQVARRVEGAPR